MSCKLKKLFIAMSFLLVSAHAQADDTLLSLERMKSRIRGIVFAVSSPNIANAQKLHLIIKNKTLFELELKQILTTEQRGSQMDEARDNAYEVIDELMLGLTAFIVLQLEADGTTIQPDSCTQSLGMLELFSQSEGKIEFSSELSPMVQVIRTMCVKNSAI